MFLLARNTDALRQMFLFELQAHRVVIRSDQIGQAVRHAQYKKDRGVYPDRDTGIAFSILTRVVRLIDARCAAIAAGMRRRRRASRMSRPSFRSAFLTGMGNTTDDLLVLIFSVRTYGR